jgi:preprotein translocase subunit SecD
MAPMEIIEGAPSAPRSARETREGLQPTKWGFLAIVLFMSLYYTLFGGSRQSRSA